jgi:hypothetical protein
VVGPLTHLEEDEIFLCTGNSIFPGAVTVLHWSFEDPAEAEGTDAERKCVFRKIRDQIRHRIQLFLATQQHR